MPGVLRKHLGAGKLHGAIVACCTVLALSAAKAGPEQIAVYVEGRGPVVVFESGLGRTHNDWRKVVPVLSRCLTTVTYDRPGLGASPQFATTEMVTADGVAKRLAKMLADRKLPAPYILVGHSLGGLYVQAFATRYPYAVAGVVLVDASSQFEPPGIFASTVTPEPGTVDAAEEAGADVSAEALRAGPPFPHIPLFVLAATDHQAPPKIEALWQEVQRKTARLSPESHFQEVHSGHDIQLDRPDAVIDAVLHVAQQAGNDVSACSGDR